MKREALELTLPGGWDQLDWKRVFGREGSVEVEVGCGKGRFLLEKAVENPEVNFLGLEYANEYFGVIAKRAKARGLRNVRVVRDEAFDFFRNRIPSQSVSAFHLLYPDPWPKKRHNKRRLIRSEFLHELRRVLAPGARINIATDHPDYFEWMSREFDQWKATFVLDRRVISDPRELGVLKGRTNYEVKYIAEGRPLHFITGHRTGF